MAKGAATTRCAARSPAAIAAGREPVPDEAEAADAAEEEPDGAEGGVAPAVGRPEPSRCCRCRLAAPTSRRRLQGEQRRVLELPLVPGTDAQDPGDGTGAARRTVQAGAQRQQALRAAAE